MGVPCGNIYKNIMLDCDFGASSVSDILYVINFNDLLFVEYDDDKNITHIQLNAGASMYTFVGKRNSVSPGYYMFPLIYSDSFSHYIDFRVFDNTAGTKEQLEKLRFGRYICIVEMYYGKEIKREAFGVNSGMILIELERIVSDYDASGSFALSLETPELSVEPHIPPQYTGDMDSIGAVCWILATGFWNDGCTWFDTDIWND